MSMAISDMGLSSRTHLLSNPSPAIAPGTLPDESPELPAQSRVIRIAMTFGDFIQRGLRVAQILNNAANPRQAQEDVRRDGARPFAETGQMSRGDAQLGRRGCHGIAVARLPARQQNQWANSPRHGRWVENPLPVGPCTPRIGSSPGTPQERKGGVGTDDEARVTDLSKLQEQMRGRRRRE